jgi:hypothetical protein
MTESETLREARRRWGPRACVGRSRSGAYLVGIALEGAIAPPYFAVRGAGFTWEDALERAAASIAARGVRHPGSLVARASHGIPLYVMPRPRAVCPCP